MFRFVKVLYKSGYVSQECDVIISVGASSITAYMIVVSDKTSRGMEGDSLICVFLR